ncbi:hypothetical protein F5Y14DRAFT_400270 [Nemania sp. NC0429]|nr:hypothetical protein F5Y14DRAFT_400270 [Nemania sp. NC0429]
MDLKKRKRVWNEIEDVNADFFNLRTVIKPSADDDLSRFYFAMSPNDGALAHMTVVGCFYIPDKYPESPPVVHVYTMTGRYNVDAYHDTQSRTWSSLCFDILRSKRAGGAWRPEYTISSLFASVMSAIVSFYVPQQHGPVRPEYVSMEKLEVVKRDAVSVYDRYKHLVPSLPSIPLVEATMVPAEQMSFPDTIKAEGNKKVTSGPIYLQDPDQSVQTFAVDLSQLHSGIVFSVILSNSKNDLVGKKPGTILVRNGVTATAARKRANDTTQWFYHGKPMNDGDMRLHVTIGRDQMTMAYYSGGRLYVHGDCPVSRLSAGQIGDVRGVPFHVHIFLIQKSGEPAEITLLDTEGKGYIHVARDDAGDTHADNESDFGFELVDGSEVAEAVEQIREQERVLADQDRLKRGGDGELATSRSKVGKDELTDAMLKMSIGTDETERNT